MTNGPSHYLSEAITRVGIMRRIAPSRIADYADAEAADFLHRVTGICEIAPVADRYDRVVKVSARVSFGIYIDLRLPEEPRQ